MTMPREIWVGAFDSVYNGEATATEIKHYDIQTKYTRSDLSENLAKALEGGPTAGPEFLEWIADRMVNVYGESENVDFVLSLRVRAQEARQALAEWRGE